MSRSIERSADKKWVGCEDLQVSIFRQSEVALVVQVYLESLRT